MSLPINLILKDEEELSTAKKLHELILRKELTGELLENLIDSLVDSEPDFIYRLTSYHVDIQNFFRQLIRPQVLLSKHYLNNHFLQSAIMTLDQHYLTLYDVLMGATLYSALLRERSSSSSRSKLLKLACQWRFYHALLFSLEAQQKNIDRISFENITVTLPKLKQMINDLLSAAHVFSHTYWQLGFAKAGMILNDVANKLSQKILAYSTSDQSERILFFSQSETLMHRSIKYYLCAFDLENNSISQSILSNFSGGKNLHDTLSTRFFEDKQVAILQLSEWVGPETFSELQLDSQKLLVTAIDALQQKKPLLPVNESTSCTTHILAFDPYETITLINNSIHSFL